MKHGCGVNQNTESTNSFELTGIYEGKQYTNLFVKCNLRAESQACVTGLLSSPEPKAHWWAYHMARPLSICLSVCQHFQTSSSPKPLRRLKPNFMWSLHGMGEWKFVRGVQVTWPRCPPCPYMVKTFKNLLLWNRWADFHETWYVALKTQAHDSLFNRWPWDDLDLF